MQRPHEVVQAYRTEGVYLPAAPGIAVLCVSMALIAGAGIDAFAQTRTDGLLGKIRAKMASNLDRLPNYTCTETIERSARDSGKEFKRIDTVRVEVAFVGGKELVSWPGAAKFEDNKDIRNFVSDSGAIGTGNFAVAAHNVFRSDAPAFSGPFEEISNGRRIIRDDFKVPLASSELRVQTNLHGAVVGYHGSFRVDGDTLDLVRLDTQADAIPEEVEIAATADWIEYARVRIGGAEFLLPVASELRMAQRTGRESLNRATFSNCRQYLGESTISFSDPAPVADGPKTPRIVQLPANMSIETSLAAKIDLDKAAIGDPVSLVVSRTVKKGSMVLAPKGALVRGRLTRLSKEASKEGSFHLIGIQLTSLETQDSQADVTANLQEAGVGNQYFVPFSTEDLMPSVWTYLVPRLPRPSAGESILLVRARTATPLPSGLRMLWQTVGGGR